jgi:hypothetical protein
MDGNHGREYPQGFFRSWERYNETKTTIETKQDGLGPFQDTAAQAYWGTVPAVGERGDGGQARLLPHIMVCFLRHKVYTIHWHRPHISARSRNKN